MAQDPARQQPPGQASGTREEALRRVHREALAAKIGQIETDLAAGQLSPAQAQDAMRTARAMHDTAVALAAIEADFPRWETWVGTLPHLLYARIPMSSPPIVVRGATPEGLRAEVEAAERRLR